MPTSRAVNPIRNVRSLGWHIELGAEQREARGVYAELPTELGDLSLDGNRLLAPVTHPAGPHLSQGLYASFVAHVPRVVRLGD